MTQEPWRRSVNCQDQAGRDRTVQVFLSEKTGRFVIQVPPGESAVLDHTSGDLLKAAIDGAQLEVLRRQAARS